MFSSGCDMMEGCSNSNMDGEDINIEGEEFVDEGGDSEGREEPIGEKKKKASGGYTCCVPLGEGPRGATPYGSWVQMCRPGLWVLPPSSARCMGTYFEYLFFSPVYGYDLSKPFVFSVFLFSLSISSIV